MPIEQSFFEEEIRCNFLVTNHRKKVWAVQLNLLEQFDLFCKKHNLRYFADYGTLLGAVRHQGYIPWDDDIDICMFRDDYQKLCAIAISEFKEPYFFQTAYNDGIICAFAKLRDSRTTALEYPNDPFQINQGIYIDIFPIDDIPDGNNLPLNIRDVQLELWHTIVAPENISAQIEQGHMFLIGNELILDLTKLTVRERLWQFETFLASQNGKSTKCNFITDELFNLSKSRPKSAYSDTIYMPFEHLMLPAPIGYHEVLSAQYGNYMEFVRGCSAHNGIFLDPDTPYTSYVNANQT